MWLVCTNCIILEMEKLDRRQPSSLAGIYVFSISVASFIDCSEKYYIASL